MRDPIALAAAIDEARHGKWSENELQPFIKFLNDLKEAKGKRRLAVRMVFRTVV